MISPRKVVDHVINPRHVTFWGVLASIATVISVILALRPSGQLTVVLPATTQQSLPTASPSSSTGASSTPEPGGYSVTLSSGTEAIQEYGRSRSIEFVFPRGALKQLPRPPLTGFCGPLYTWVHANGGNDRQVTVTEFIIAAQSSQVIADSIQLEIESTAATAGETIRCGGGDLLPGRYLFVDLDSGAAELYTSATGDGATRTPFRLLIKPGDAERIQMIATTKSDQPIVYRWRLKLNLVVNGQRVTKIVDNNSQPFVTIANCNGGCVDAMN